MRIYEGAPRQDYEEVLRSLGAIIDQRGMREILLAETTDGYLLQGIAASGGSEGWTDPAARIEKETFNLVEDDVARFMDEALGRRSSADPADAGGGFYERSLRVIGRYFDEQKPRDIFLFEQDHAFVVRLLMPTRTGTRHVLIEFTTEDIEALIADGPALRRADEPSTEGSPAG